MPLIAYIPLWRVTLVFFWFLEEKERKKREKLDYIHCTWELDTVNLDAQPAVALVSLVGFMFTGAQCGNKGGGSMFLTRFNEPEPVLFVMSLTTYNEPKLSHVMSLTTCNEPGS
jgi:hypothetical protein